MRRNHPSLEVTFLVAILATAAGVWSLPRRLLEDGPYIFTASTIKNTSQPATLDLGGKTDYLSVQAGSTVIFQGPWTLDQMVVNTGYFSFASKPFNTIIVQPGSRLVLNGTSINIDCPSLTFLTSAMSASVGTGAAQAGRPVLGQGLSYQAVDVDSVIINSWDIANITFSQVSVSCQAPKGCANSGSFHASVRSDNELLLALQLAFTPNASTGCHPELVNITLLNNISIIASQWPREGVIVPTSMTWSGPLDALTIVDFQLGMSLFVVSPGVTVTMNNLVLLNLGTSPPAIFGFPVYAFKMPTWFSRKGMVFNNCTIVVYTDEFRYTYLWMHTFTAPSKDVSKQVDWMAYFVTEMVPSDEGSNYITYSKLEVLSAKYTNCTVTSRNLDGRLLKQTGGLDLILMGRELDIVPAVIPVSTPQDLLDYVQNPAAALDQGAPGFGTAFLSVTRPVVMLVSNISLANTSVPSAGIPVNRTVTIMGAPDAFTTLNLAYYVSVWTLQGSAKLELKNLQLTGLGSLATFKPGTGQENEEKIGLAATIGTPVWAVSYERSKTRLTLTMLEVVVGQEEWLLVTTCANYRVRDIPLPRVCNTVSLDGQGVVVMNTSASYSSLEDLGVQGSHVSISYTETMPHRQDLITVLSSAGVKLPSDLPGANPPDVPQMNNTNRPPPVWGSSGLPEAEDEDNGNSKGSSTGAIIGGVVGAVGGSALLLFVGYLLYSRRQEALLDDGKELGNDVSVDGEDKGFGRLPHASSSSDIEGDDGGDDGSMMGRDRGPNQCVEAEDGELWQSQPGASGAPCRPSTRSVNGDGGTNAAGYELGSPKTASSNSNEAAAVLQQTSGLRKAQMQGALAGAVPCSVRVRIQDTNSPAGAAASGSGQAQGQATGAAVRVIIQRTNMASPSARQPGQGSGSGSSGQLQGQVSDAPLHNSGTRHPDVQMYGSSGNHNAGKRASTVSAIPGYARRSSGESAMALHTRTVPEVQGQGYSPAEAGAGRRLSDPLHGNGQGGPSGHHHHQSGVTASVWQSLVALFQGKDRGARELERDRDSRSVRKSASAISQNGGSPRAGAQQQAVREGSSKARARTEPATVVAAAVLCEDGGEGTGRGFAVSSPSKRDGSMPAFPGKDQQQPQQPQLQYGQHLAQAAQQQQAAAQPAGQQQQPSSPQQGQAQAQKGAAMPSPDGATVADGAGSAKPQPSPSQDDVLVELSGMVHDLTNEIQDNQLDIQGIIGSGAFGTVYKGTWQGMPVAVKTLLFTHGSAGKAAALREAAISRSVYHPNLVGTYAFDVKNLGQDALAGEANSKTQHLGLKVVHSGVMQEWRLYIIQEYCDAGSIKAALQQRRFWLGDLEMPNLAAVLEVALGIARGMRHLHSKNIIHGDLNPNNVLLKVHDASMCGYIAKVCDFGMSVRMVGNQSHVTRRQGTPFYIAPEVSQYGKLTLASDVFSFGVMMWELYNGMTVWKSDKYNPKNYLPRDNFPYFPVDCPAAFAKLAAACLQRAPSGRPTFGAVVAMLEAMMGLEDPGHLAGAQLPRGPASQNYPRDCASEPEPDTSYQEGVNDEGAGIGGRSSSIYGAGAAAGAALRVQGPGYRGPAVAASPAAAALAAGAASGVASRDMPPSSNGASWQQCYVAGDMYPQNAAAMGMNSEAVGGESMVERHEAVALAGGAYAAMVAPPLGAMRHHQYQQQQQQAYAVYAQQQQQRVSAHYQAAGQLAWPAPPYLDTAQGQPQPQWGVDSGAQQQVYQAGEGVAVMRRLPMQQRTNAATAPTLARNSVS